MILPLVTISHIVAQDAREWIDYDAQYYKVRVAESGLYRVTGTQMMAAGMSNPDGSLIRVYVRGMEIPVYVSTDGLFTESDYIEFWGGPNDGTFDRELFDDPDEQQLNPGYSMFIDTAAYFITSSLIDGATEPRRLLEHEFEAEEASNPLSSYRHVLEEIYTENVFQHMAI